MMCYLKDVVRRINNNQFVKRLSQNSFIINEHLPICSNCIYYQKYISPITKIEDNELSRCRKFGHKNLIDGTIIYNHTIFTRNSDSYCGEHGKYFVDKNGIIERK